MISDNEINTNGDEELTESEMKNILDLFVDIDYGDETIKDLTGLEYAVNLKNLNLSGNNITSLEPLSNLTNLLTLYLSSNDISDISALGNIKSLKCLYLDDNNISNIDALSNLTNLTDLSLNSNKISDISMLSNLNKLENLSLGSNNIDNISGLADLTNLKALYLGDNKISDVSVLNKLTNLEYLDLSINNITNINTLSNLTNLTDLSLSTNKISDINVLKNLTNLSFLTLDENNITDIDVLSNFTNLSFLMLGDNKINNITALGKLTNLESLYLENNEIADINVLGNLKNLEYLNLSNNNIEDVSVFDDGDNCTLPKLYTLDLSNNLIDVNKALYRANWMSKIDNFQFENQRLINYTECQISKIANQSYTGKEVKPKIIIKQNQEILKENIHYTLSYKNNINLGTATVTINGKGRYKGTTTINFKIVMGTIQKVAMGTQTTSSVTVSWAKYNNVTGYEVYMSTSKNGTYKKVAIITKNSTVKYNKTKLSAGKNYYFKVRAYKTVSGKKNYGAYSGVIITATKTKTPSITKLSAGKKKATIKWKKVSGATGYEVYMSTSKGKGYKKIATNTKNSKVSYTKTKLKSKKKYYFKIRTYKTVSGKKVYSSYSKVKTVKVK